MAVSVAVLVEPTLVSDSTVTQYTAASTAAIIDKFTVTNVSAAAASMTVYLVASGGSAGSNNRIVVNTSIPASATYTFPEIVGHVLVTGDFIATIASAPNALSLRVSGRIVT